MCPAGRSPLGAGSLPLAARRDSARHDPAARAWVGAPRCPQETTSPTPQPGSARRGPRGLRRDGRPTRRAIQPHHPLARDIEAGAKRLLAQGLACVSVENGQEWEIRPAGHRSDHAGGCGSRAGVSRWGIAGLVSYEQRGAPARDVPARSHAQAGRRAGLEARPERPLPARGANERAHVVKTEGPSPRARRQEGGGATP